MKMFKWIKDVYQPYILRPIIYKSCTKASIAFVLSLVWDRFINTGESYRVVSDAFFVAGLFFFACVWFQYLHLDGIRVDHLSKPEKKKERKRFFSKDIVDFADEKIISYDELEEEERAACRVLSNVICGIVFLIPSFISLIIW